jgi:uncharacterized membrane protein YidH (DUF202 family)
LNVPLVKNSDLRTQLAEKRTDLAKERTLLAFMRTGLALIALGLALIRYFGMGVWTVMDVLLILTGLITMNISVRSYRSAYRKEQQAILIIDKKMRAAFDLLG